MAYILLSKIIAATVIFVIFLVLLKNSLNAIGDVGTGFFSVHWDPSAGLYGILPMLYGSAAVTFLSLLMAAPLGLFSALCISEIVSPKYRIFLKTALELLAGIPSIVYGLIGMLFISTWVADIFQLTFGRTILTASVVLALMILPTIMTLCEDALRDVPHKYRESAYGLALTRFEVIFKVIIPMAKPAIAGAILLGAGRAIGETMAVMLVIGSIDRIPTPFFNILDPGQTITSKLGRELGESSLGSLHFSALVTLGLILMVFVAAITFTARYFFIAEERLYE
ncbi:MAG: phosphate ABC transporter permease subunit PstC [Nitrospinota bacterium]